MRTGMSMSGVCHRCHSLQTPRLACLGPRLSPRVVVALRRCLLTYLFLAFPGVASISPRPDTAPHQLATPLPSRRLRLLDVDSGVREGRHRHRRFGVARPGVAIEIEQGATMFDTPAALGCPTPLACRPLAGLRGLTPRAPTLDRRGYRGGDRC